MKTRKKKRNGKTSNLKYKFIQGNGEESFVDTYFKFPHKSGIEISTHSYSNNKKSNDQYCLIIIGEETMCVKVRAIKRCDENDESYLDIYYNPSIVVNDGTYELTNGRVYKIQIDNNVVAIAKFDTIVEQVLS